MIVLDGPTTEELQLVLTSEPDLQAIMVLAHGDKDGDAFSSYHGTELEVIHLSAIRSSLASRPTGFLREVVLHSCYLGKKAADNLVTFRYPQRSIHQHETEAEIGLDYFWELLHVPPIVGLPSCGASDSPPHYTSPSFPATACYPDSSTALAEGCDASCFNVPPFAKPYVNDAQAKINLAYTLAGSGDMDGANARLHEALQLFLEAQERGAEVDGVIHDLREVLGLPLPAFGGLQQVALAVIMISFGVWALSRRVGTRSTAN